MMMCAYNAVNRWIAHIHIWGSHIDLGAQGLGTVRERAGAHLLEQRKIFFRRAVAIRAVLTGLGQRAALGAHFLL